MPIAADPIGAAGPKRRGDIPALTGLRGAAALWVTAYHLLLPAHFVGGLPARLAARGYLAVDIFFVLSGFVMALTYGQLFARGFSAGVMTGFLRRRIARLYPIYGVILLGRFAYTALRYHTFDLPRPWIASPLTHPWAAIPANALLVQSWGIAESAIGPAWSISTEWAAYWAFPLLAMAMLHRRASNAWAMAVLAAAVLVASAALLPTGAQGWTLDLWDGRTVGPLLRCLAGFTLGLGIERLRSFGPASRWAGRPGVLPAVLAALLGLLAAGAPDLALYPLFPALVLCLASRPAGPFAWPGMVWLGEVSYSLYLLHIFLLHPLDQTRATLRLLVPAGLADLLAVALILILLLAAADIAYRCIERPGRRLLARSIPI